MRHFYTTKTVANQEKVRSFSYSATSKLAKKDVLCLDTIFAQLAGAVKYTNYFSTEG